VHPGLRRRKPFRTPLNFFVAGVLFFVIGLVAAPFVIGEATEFFYQPMLLALVHSFTLGWITATIMGVMYRYVPSLTHSRIRFPRLAAAQFALYVIGVLGMVTHFASGDWWVCGGRRS
jgi:cbb3-type cytochrome oxidase subunit 1